MAVILDSEQREMLRHFLVFLHEHTDAFEPHNLEPDDAWDDADYPDLLIDIYAEHAQGRTVAHRSDAKAREGSDTTGREITERAIQMSVERAMALSSGGRDLEMERMLDPRLWSAEKANALGEGQQWCRGRLAYQDRPAECGKEITHPAHGFWE